jgi:leucyl/phenylalanyl-tRNA--protein transferase
VFPPAESADERGLVHVGGDLRPDALLTAYRNGLFPMAPGDGPMRWWSPDPRAILPVDGLRVSRSLRRSRDRYEVRVDTAFGAVIEACADPRREYAWVTPAVRDAYVELHRQGWAHSVESWTPDGELAGGLYGVAIGGFFAGESMFARRRDASKVALVALIDGLGDGDDALVDVQYPTPHLVSLGAVAIPRTDFLRRLRVAVDRPRPAFLGREADL